ncbi:MTOR-associated protein MEAK7 isoform X2 [Alosa pseudoharengus]|uniref:MTOR-associated protein MEAK7 isoform X2 n=1 Tax=Alosa pseudoharengus TaxID=34774 RepID=UPI003F8CBE50
MGNTESVVVQKRLTRFRPDERPVVEGVFEQLQAGSAGAAGKPGKALTVDMLKASMGSIASDSTIMRVYAGMTSIDAEAPPAPGGGVSREQLVIFLADTLRGTAEERAPLVMAMAQQGGKGAMATVDQIKQFLEDLISAAVQILDHRGRLRGWKPEHMGDGTRGVKLLAEQLSSEIKASDQQTCDTACLEDWLFRVSSVAVYLELLVSEGLSVTLPSRPPPTLLPLCREPPWGQLRTSLLDVPLLLFLAPLLPTGTSAPWRLLFSTHLHGESFTRLVSGCKGRGPTVLLLRDTKGHVFGGFASHSWEIRPQFQVCGAFPTQETPGAFSSPCPPVCECTPALAITSITCTSTRDNRPCPMAWVWVGNMATLGCGWTVTSVVGTAVPGQSAQRTAAPSCRLRRTSVWTLWSYGLSASPLNRNRMRTRGAFWMWTQRCRP